MIRLYLSFFGCLFVLFFVFFSLFVFSLLQVSFILYDTFFFFLLNHQIMKIKKIWLITLSVLKADFSSIPNITNLSRNQEFSLAIIPMCLIFFPKSKPPLSLFEFLNFFFFVWSFEIGNYHQYTLIDLDFCLYLGSYIVTTLRLLYAPSFFGFLSCRGSKILCVSKHFIISTEIPL